MARKRRLPEWLRRSAKRRGGKGKRRRPARKGTAARLRGRYLAAGWIGVGLVAGLLLGIGLWALLAAPPAPRQAAMAPQPERGAPERPKPAEPAPAPRPAPPPDTGLDGHGPRAAIIIDDMGNNWDEARAVSGLPYPVAVAVLPGTPFAARTARRAHDRGKEVLAHMPMQPEDPSIPLGDTFLRADMDRQQMLATLRSNLAGIPYVQGINNHMGSLLTSRVRPMRWVMQSLRRRGLYFIDSRTTAATKGLTEARAVGLPAAQRDVFLDHTPTEAAVRSQFHRLLQKARSQGTAIAIGHPHPATIKVLRRMLPEASRHGVEIVPLREVVAVRNPQVAGMGALAYHGSESDPGGTP